jgi:hypothetical protein
MDVNSAKRGIEKIDLGRILKATTTKISALRSARIEGNSGLLRFCGVIIGSRPFCFAKQVIGESASLSPLPLGLAGVLTMPTIECFVRRHSRAGIPKSADPINTIRINHL